MTMTDPLTVTIRSETRSGKFIPRDGNNVETFTHRPQVHCCACGNAGHVWCGESSEQNGTALHVCATCKRQWWMFFGFAEAPDGLVQHFKDREMEAGL